eukprot:1357853-Amorphochlora_amoeboformis.AAC.2
MQDPKQHGSCLPTFCVNLSVQIDSIATATDPRADAQESPIIPSQLIFARVWRNEAHDVHVYSKTLPKQIPIHVLVQVRRDIRSYSVWRISSSSTWLGVVILALEQGNIVKAS